MRHITCFLSVLLIGGLVLATAAGAMDERDLAEIQKAIQEKGARWKAADNPIFRLSTEEQRRLCGALPDPPELLREHYGLVRGPLPELPERLDWRDKDGVNWLTPIRNQGGCGSCVAFGTIAAFEGRINIYADSPGQELDLSEQHIFSCGGGSCDFGWSPSAAAQYLQDYGAPMESCLPYLAVDDNCDQTCDDWQEQARKILEWGAIPYTSPQQTVEQMKVHLLDGPLVASFSVYEDFDAYSSGVYQHVWGDLRGGHCISIVGWDDADSCWIVKNSWGAGWGEDGYFRIRMGHNEVGIEEDVKWMVPAPAYAYVQIEDYTIVDHVAGNGDGVPDPGETFDFTMTLSNPRTWGSLTGVQGWLLSTDPRVITLDVLANYPDLPDGQTCTNGDDPFTIEMTEEIGVVPIPFTLYITGTCNSSFPYSGELQFQLPITVALTGWPAQTSAGVRCSPLMAWVGGNPRRLVALEDNGTLHMWDKWGQEDSGFPLSAPGGQVWGSVAMGDLDGDGQEEMVFGSKNDTLYAFHSDGTLLFKRDMGADILATPAIADLESDGSLEIVLGTMNSELYVLTAQGQKYGPFPIVLGGPVMADAALADLNQDGFLDVVVGAQDGQVYAISVQTGETLTGWPVTTGGAIWSSPVIADLNNDGDLETIVGSDDRSLYVISPSGSVLFTYPTGQPIRCSPAVANLDANNRLDVIFTSQDGKVYAVNHQGYSLSGWPYNAGGILWTSPIVLDIDGDGALEVVLEAPGPELIHLQADGSLLMNLSIDASGTVMSTPVAGDLDNDGDLEIAVGGPKGVYVWNYPTTSDVDIPWPMYRGSARRTGYVGDVTTGRSEESPNAPTVPTEFALWQNFPNPFNPQTTIRYSLAQDGPVRLTIFNVLGQEVISLVDDHQTAGLHTVAWNGADSRGHLVSSGLYFYRLETENFVQTRKMVLLR